LVSSALTRMGQRVMNGAFNLAVVVTSEAPRTPCVRKQRDASRNASGLVHSAKARKHG
jgi:hypothetical protein